MQSAPDPQNSCLLMREASPTVDNNTAGNIKPSSSMLFPVSTLPEVLLLFTDVPGVLPAEKRGFDPSAIGSAVVVFHENGGASKPYVYPAFFWSEV